MRIILWILLAGIFASFHAANTTGIGEDIAVVRICNATDPVDIDVLNDYMMHHDIRHWKNHSRELSCFLLCIYNKYKWMDQRGIFETRKIKSWLRTSDLRFNDQEILLEKCVTTGESSNPCERALLFTECFWLNHRGTVSSEEDGHTLNAMIRKKSVA